MFFVGYNSNSIHWLLKMTHMKLLDCLIFHVLLSCLVCLFIYELQHNLGLRMVKNQFRKCLTIHFDHTKGFPNLNLNMQYSFIMLIRSNDYVFSNNHQNNKYYQHLISLIHWTRTCILQSVLSDSSTNSFW